MQPPFEIWFLYGVVPLATMTMVPLGIALHFWWRADARVVATLGPDESDVALQRAVGAQRARGMAASVILVLAIVLSRTGGPLPHRADDEWYAYLVPLVVATLSIVLLLVRRPVRSSVRGSDSTTLLDLRTRSIASFAERWWLAAWLLCAGVLFAAVIGTGLLSSPDTDGRYTELQTSLGEGGFSVISSIAGWYFGVPLIGAALLLLGVTLLALTVQSRPALGRWGSSQRLESALRRSAMRTVLALSTAALLVTLGMVLNSVGGAAAAMLGFPASGMGMVTIGTSIAALETPLMVASFLAQGLGLALALLPLFSRRPRVATLRSVEGQPADAGDASVALAAGQHSR